MKLGILRTPHANARYEEATKQLLINQILLVSQALGQPIHDLGYEVFGGLELLTFTLSDLDISFERALGRVGDSFVLFEIKGEALLPRHTERDLYFPKDMASIQKYSGKTNEAFTLLLILVSVFSGRFAKDFDTPLILLDPMCGRGTTLYQGLMLGYHMAGIDQDKMAINEMGQFVKRYLKYHLYKHTASHQTVHQEGKVLGVKHLVETAKTTEAYKAKDRRTLQFALGDTRLVNGFYKKNSFHGLVVDLPYGVQHKGRDGGKGTDLAALLSEAAPQWHKVLMKGACAVIAYNRHSFDREPVDLAFEAAGFRVLRDGVYGQFEHWVEQAVTRDILVYQKI